MFNVNIFQLFLTFVSYNYKILAKYVKKSEDVQKKVSYHPKYDLVTLLN